MRSEVFTPSGMAFYASLATLVWIMLPIGIYLGISGSLVWGLTLSFAAVILIIVAASTSLVDSFRSRQIPRARGYFMVVGVATSAVVTALYSISLFQPVRSLAILGILHAAGTLVLGGWATVALSRSITQRGNVISGQGR